MEKLSLTARIDSPNGLLDLTDSAGHTGWVGRQFYLLSNNRPLFATSGSLVQQDDSALTWEGDLAPQVTLRLRVQRSKVGCGWTITPTLHNKGVSDLRFSGYGFRGAPEKPGVCYQQPGNGLAVFAHTDNLRYEKLPHCRGQYPFIRPIPAAPTQLGNQPSGPIPALFLGQTESNVWLLEGALTQDRHVLSWHLDLPTLPRQMVDCRTEFTWMGGADEIVRPGEARELETTLCCMVGCTPDRLYDAYVEELTAVHRFTGPQSRLDREPVYCTWNFSIFTNITEVDCLKRMDIVEKVQRGGFFQIDHGYQPPATAAGGQASPEVNSYYPDGKGAWDSTRFPSGPHGFVQACRQRGLRPAIWWSPRVDLNGVIQREHPEWLLLDRAGQPINDVGHLMLDCSVLEARAFMEQCVRLMTAEWGFEGIKLDFFSWMFDHPAIRYRHGETGVFWKRWFLRLLRDGLGPSGYLLHGISCPMGNPFLAIDGCDSYRAGIDIHSGEWDFHVRNCGWLLPGMLCNDRRTWFGNIDSFMGAPEIPAIERRSRNAFGYITAGMLEFSGPIEKLDATALEEYRRLVERCDQGGRVSCPDTDAFFGRPIPRLLVRHHAAGSRTRDQFGATITIGLFNWTDNEAVVSVSLTQLGLDPKAVELRDFWTGQKHAFSSDAVTVVLPPRGHAIWDGVAR